MRSIGKTELARRIAADNTGVSAGIAEQVIESFMRHVRLTTADGTAVQLKGFGTFKLKYRPTRTGRNPRTGEAVAIPERTVMVFTASKHRE